MQEYAQLLFEAELQEHLLVEAQKFRDIAIRALNPALTHIQPLSLNETIEPIQGVKKADRWYLIKELRSIKLAYFVPVYYDLLVNGSRQELLMNFSFELQTAEPDKQVNWHLIMLRLRTGLTLANALFGLAIWQDDYLVLAASLKHVIAVLLTSALCYSLFSRGLSEKVDLLLWPTMHVVTGLQSVIWMIVGFSLFSAGITG